MQEIIKSSIREDRSFENDDLFQRVANWASLQFKINISKKNILEALVLILSEREQLTYAIEIWDINYSFEELVRLIEPFDFSILNCTIESSNFENLSSHMMQKKVRIKNGGMIWVIHANDADPFPSKPHAHNIENCIKLDLSNGCCYKKSRIFSTITKKELIEIRNKAEIVYKGALPDLTV